MELGIWHAEKYKHTVWYERTIVDILRNPTYTGCIVYGRVPKSLYQRIKMHRADPDEWRILPDMHEPIVSRELFDEVQKILDDRAELAKKKKAKTKEQRDSIVNLFVKRIYCGDCGKRMRFVKKAIRKNPRLIMSAADIWTAAIRGVPGTAYTQRMLRTQSFPL